MSSKPTQSALKKSGGTVVVKQNTQSNGENQQDTNSTRSSSKNSENTQTVVVKQNPQSSAENQSCEQQDTPEKDTVPLASNQKELFQPSLSDLKTLLLQTENAVTHLSGTKFLELEKWILKLQEHQLSFLTSSLHSTEDKIDGANKKIQELLNHLEKENASGMERQNQNQEQLNLMLSTFASQMHALQETVDFVKQQSIDTTTKVDQIYKLVEGIIKKEDTDMVVAANDPNFNESGNPIRTQGTNSNSTTSRVIFIYRSSSALTCFPDLEQILESKINNYFISNPTTIKSYYGFSSKKVSISVSVQTIKAGNKFKNPMDQSPAAMIYVSYSPGSRVDEEKAKADIEILDREYGLPIRLCVLRYGDEMSMVELKKWEGQFFQLQYNMKGLVEASPYNKSELARMIDFVKTKIS